MRKPFPSAHQAQSRPQKKRGNALSLLGFGTYCVLLPAVKFALLCGWWQLQCCALLGNGLSRVALGGDSTLWRVTDRDGQRLSPGLIAFRDRLLHWLRIRPELRSHPVMAWMGGGTLLFAFVSLCFAVR
jgi:hypothetical protein